MKLRARIALSLLLSAFAVILGLTLFLRGQRQQAFLDASYEAALERMEAGGREACEARPESWPAARERAPRPRRRATRRGRRRGGWRGGRRGPGARQIFVYDSALRSRSPRAPALSPAMRSELESEPMAMEWLDARRVRVAARMPWESGPCALLVVDRQAPPELGGPAELLPALLRSAALATLAALLVLLLLGPVVRRIRRLTEAVGRAAEGGYKEPIEVRGGDEVSELARAFNAASEQIRAQISDLERRDEALTEYIQNTTHDVMVPLNVLQGHLLATQRALREGDEVDPERLKKALEESHYLASLMHNLSAAARLGAGAIGAPKRGGDGAAEQLVALGEIVTRAAQRHGPIAEQRGIAVEHAVPEEELLVRGDPTLLERAISNLVHNAVRYNKEGGHVAVFTERRPGGRFAIVVLDDGPGIPAEELSLVQNKRFRGGEARTRRPSGLGLGLHIVRTVVERHGFALRFESPEEGGLRVEIEGALSDP